MDELLLLFNMNDLLSGSIAVDDTAADLTEGDRGGESELIFDAARFDLRILIRKIKCLINNFKRPMASF